MNLSALLLLTGLSLGQAAPAPSTPAPMTGIWQLSQNHLVLFSGADHLTLERTGFVTPGEK